MSHTRTSLSLNVFSEWQGPSGGAFRIAVLYLIVGALWILFSDQAAAAITNDPAMLVQISLYKGWGYIFFTALALFVLIQYQIDALQKSRTQYQLLAENISDVIWVLDVNTARFLYISPSIKRLRGYTVEEALQEAPLDTLTPESWDYLQRMLPERIKTFVNGHTHYFTDELEQLCKDGSRIWVEITSRFVLNPKNGHVELYGISRDVSQRKHAQELVQKSQTQLRWFIEQAPLSIAMFDQDMNYLATSRRWLNEYGRGYPDLVGRNHYVVNPDLPTEWKEAHQDGLAGITVKNDEDSWIQADGSQQWLRWAISPWIDDHGKVGGIILSAEDITDHKKAERQLQISEERYRSLFENMADGVAHCQMLYENGQPVDFVYMNVNPAFETLTGLKESAGKRVTELIPGIRESNPELFEIYNRVATTRKPEKFETYVPVLNNGTWFSVSVYSPEKEQFVAVFEVITERKQAEERLQKSEARFSKAFNANPAAMVITRISDGKILDVNESCQRIFGYTREELIGNARATLNIYPQSNEPPIVEKHLRRDGFIRDYEASLRTKSNTLIQVLFSLELVEIEGESCTLTTIIDITDRKRAEEELRHTLADLKRSNVELEQFAYVASHDLQEPLRALTGMVQLLQKRYQGQLDARADEYIAHTVEAANRMQTLINDLLSYSRVGTRARAFETVDMHLVLQSTLANLSVLIQENEAVITHDPLPTVRADALQLGQVFQNLLGNAIKFRRDQPPHIHVGVERLHDAWRFSVQDNGIGIDPQYFERIFAVFQRLHTRREYPGTGIGLAICKKIIERHGGLIGVESQPGKGSTFYFTIPH